MREVLHTTLQENLNMIADSVRFLCQAGKTVFFDAEHFFDGYAANPALCDGNPAGGERCGGAVPRAV